MRYVANAVGLKCKIYELGPSEGALCESITFPSHRLGKESARPTATLLQNRNQKHKKTISHEDQDALEGQEEHY